MSRFLSCWVTPSDDQLMWRVKAQSDPKAFAELVARWEKPIQRLCARMIGDPHRAEDLAQTVFVRLFAGRADWKPAASLSTFIWRIGLNLCHDEVRKRRRRGECSFEVLEGEDGGGIEELALAEPTPDVQAEASERGELVRQAMLRLAPHYREVLVLRHYEGLKFHEIATVLDIPEGTVKSRMAEALTQMSRFLRHLDDEPPRQATTSPRIPAAS